MEKNLVEKKTLSHFEENISNDFLNEKNLKITFSKEHENDFFEVLFYVLECKEWYKVNSFKNKLKEKSNLFLDYIDFKKINSINESFNQKEFKEYIDNFYQILKSQNLNKSWNFFKRHFEGNYCILNLIKTIQPYQIFPDHFKDELNYLNLIKQLFGNQQEKSEYIKYISALSTILLSHKDFILQVLDKCNLEQKYLFAQYLYLIGVDISIIFSNEDYVLLQAKLHNDFESNQLNNEQKFNIFYFLSNLINHNAIISFFDDKKEMIVKDKMVLDFICDYKQILNLKNLENFIVLYNRVKSFEDNLLIQNNVSVDFLLDLEDDGLNLSNNQYNFKKTISFIYKTLEIKRKILKNNFYEVEDINQTFHLHLNEFFWLFKKDLDKHILSLENNEKEFFVDSLEFLSKSNAFSNDFFIKSVVKKQNKKWNELNNIFYANDKNLEKITTFFELINLFLKENILFSKEKNSLKILKLLLSDNDKISVISSKKEKKNKIQEKNFNKRQILEFSQAIESLEGLVRNNEMKSIFTIIYDLLKEENNQNNIDVVFDKILTSKIFKKLNQKHFSFYYKDLISIKHKNKKNKNFSFKLNENVHYLLNDLEDSWNNTIKIALSEEKNYQVILIDFINNLCKQNFIKPYLQSNLKLEQDLISLKEVCPNFKDAIDYFISQLRLNKQSQGIKPILLCGETGVGKTFFVEKLSSILNTKVEMISCPVLSSEHTLAGIHRSYKSAKAGLIYQTLFDGKNANPCVVFDKFDQIEKDSINYVLSSLLEKESSKNYLDDFEGVKIDASKAIYIATANDLNEINPTLLDKFEIIKIKRPSKENLHSILEEMWSKFKKSHNKLCSLSSSIKEELVKYNLNEIQSYLNKIANYMILNGNHIDYEKVYNIIKERKEINIEIGAENFSILDPKDIQHSIEDVRGCEEAKKQVFELITLFTSPMLNKIGLKKPKGLVLYGPPGVGKTMLAKSFAKSVNMPFLALSGSSFVEQYVGVGAKRVRQLFEKARQHSPCIIYIDEMDALGKRGDSNNSERDATINEFLVQLDGAKNNDGIFVIGSTNYLNNLDNALIRAGRFDRKIELKLPYLNERKEILEYLSKDFNLTSNIDLSHVAKMTNGNSPADLVNLLNQAAIIAVRNNREEIQIDDFNEAFDEIELGIKNPKEKDENKKVTAYHEAGHAVLGYLLKNCNPVRKVTIVPRANSLGVTISYPEDDDLNITKDKILDKICMTLGGRSAEKIFIKSISTGASGDIRQVTHLAKNMVTKYGFAEDDYLSMLLFDNPNDLSDKTKNKIEEEMLRIVKIQLDKSEKILENNINFVHGIANALLEKEIIYEEDIDKIAIETNVFNLKNKL